MITKSSFLDKTKMTTIYIKTKVTITDIHTHAHVVSIDNARYECLGLSRAYERMVQSVHRARRSRKRPMNLWRAPQPQPQTFIFYFFYFFYFIYITPVNNLPLGARKPERFTNIYQLTFSPLLFTCHKDSSSALAFHSFFFYERT